MNWLLFLHQLFRFSLINLGIFIRSTERCILFIFYTSLLLFMDLDIFYYVLLINVNLINLNNEQLQPI